MAFQHCTVAQCDKEKAMRLKTQYQIENHCTPQWKANGAKLHSTSNQTTAPSWPLCSALTVAYSGGNTARQRWPRGVRVGGIGGEWALRSAQPPLLCNQPITGCVRIALATNFTALRPSRDRAKPQRAGNSTLMIEVCSQRWKEQKPGMCRKLPSLALALQT